MSNPDKDLFTRTEPEYTVADSEPADQTLDTSDMTRTADAAKKKKANLIKIGAIVAAVIVIFVGLELVAGGSDTPPPAPKLTKVAPPPAPPAPAPAPAPEKAPEPATPAVTAPDAAAPAPTPMAEPVPVSGGVSLPPNPAAPQAPVAVEAGKDLASLNIPNPAKDAPAVAAVADPVKPAPSLVPVPVEPVKGASTDTSQFVKQGEFNLLADRVTALENEMASLRQLDDRVKKLEEAAGQAPAKATTPAAPAADKKSDAWVDGKAAKKAVKPAAKQVKVAEPKVKNVVKRSDEESVTKKAKASSGGVANQFQLVAIVQGRAWLKTSDGSTLTVQDGDVLPNGAKIVKVDPRRDEVQTSEGTLR